MKFFARKKEQQVEKRVTVPRVVRGFAAAQVDRLLQGWQSDFGYTPGEIAAHLSTVRGRARQMAKDSPHFKRWLSSIATNVVGEGFTLKATPYDVINSVKRLDKQASKFIEYHWRRFCTWRDPLTQTTYFDLTGRKTEAEMDRLNVKTWARDGEFFMQVLRTDLNPYGIAFRVLRPDWCDHTYSVADTGRGTLIHCGVEKELGTMRPVAYWFTTTRQHAQDFNRLGQPIMGVPARQIIHCFTQDDEDQPRGIPWGHAALRKLKMLDMYDEAELTAARDEACSVRTYYAERGSDDEIADLTDDENSAIAQSLVAEKEPGQSEVLPVGWRQDVHTPQHPNKEVTNFKSSMLRDIATGFEVEYANFANDWAAVSFSSVRLGTIGERDSWIVRQDDMINQCKSIQFLVWLRSFLELDISGQLPIAKYNKFAEHSFRGRRWMWVDPMKDMNAAKIARDHGWKTDTQITEEMGGDFDENLELMKIENEDRQKNGIPAPAAAAAAPATVKPSDEDEDEKEDAKQTDQ